MAGRRFGGSRTGGPIQATAAGTGVGGRNSQTTLNQNLAQCTTASTAAVAADASASRSGKAVNERTPSGPGRRLQSRQRSGGGPGHRQGHRSSEGRGALGELFRNQAGASGGSMALHLKASSTSAGASLLTDLFSNFAKLHTPPDLCFCRAEPTPERSVSSTKTFPVPRCGGRGYGGAGQRQRYRPKAGLR